VWASAGALVVNVLATVALAAVGALFLGERLHWTTVAGAAICLVGLGVMSLRGGA
jgi:drug/metabolite transporter (DMT)-like permease